MAFAAAIASKGTKALSSILVPNDRPSMLPAPPSAFAAFRPWLSAAAMRRLPLVLSVIGPWIDGGDAFVALGNLCAGSSDAVPFSILRQHALFMPATTICMAAGAIFAVLSKTLHRCKAWSVIICAPMAAIYFLAMLFTMKVGIDLSRASGFQSPESIALSAVVSMMALCFLADTAATIRDRCSPL